MVVGGEQPFGPPLKEYLGMHNTRGGRWGVVLAVRGTQLTLAPYSLESESTWF